MITTNCRGCGAGPMDLPGDEICDDCHIEMRNEDPDAHADDEYAVLRRRMPMPGAGSRRTLK